MWSSGSNKNLGRKLVLLTLSSGKKKLKLDLSPESAHRTTLHTAYSATPQADTQVPLSSNLVLNSQKVPTLATDPLQKTLIAQLCCIMEISFTNLSQNPWGWL